MPSPAEHQAVPYERTWGSRLDSHVRSIMRAGVIAVPEDASVRQVQRALVEHRVHAILVVRARSGDPVGWATTRGVLERALGDAALLPAALAVTEPVETISPGATAEDALRMMVERGAARLLVCRKPGAPPEGVLTDMDLVRLTARD